MTNTALAAHTIATAAPARRWVSAVLWTLVLPFAGWAFLRVFGWEPKFRWSQLVSFTPYAAAASLVPTALALVLRRWPVALTALAVSVVLVAVVAPRAFGDRNPVVSGPALRVLTANLYHSAVTADTLLDSIQRIRPDVLAVFEYEPGLREAMDKAGIAEFLPFHAVFDDAYAKGTAIYARYPMTPGKLIPGDGPNQVATTLSLPGDQLVDFVAVHACAPSGGWRSACWESSVRALPPAGGRLRILGGDFNSTLDHRVMRDLIATGYRDAADVTGMGLRTTWPYIGQPWFIRKIAIDHVLADPRIAVRAFRVIPMPGSDHRAVLTDLTLPGDVR
ncbi:endonuclease/exonuclease/phosphatase family protein [Streptosporangiaceae bacterium NEAU-GS5]|nr:endonuclease/exonuclease/phosphatase family protein [Streptosporangiaceae bacterium NEAU-GS5]